MGELDQNPESMRRNNLDRRCRKIFSVVELSCQISWRWCKGLVAVEEDLI